jgi:hypothetical protein
MRTSRHEGINPISKPLESVSLSLRTGSGGFSRNPLMGLTAMAGILVFSLVDASRVGLAGRFGLEMPDWFVTALSVVRFVKSNGLDLPICDALWAGETSSSCSVRRLLGLALPDVVIGMEFACFRFEGRGDVSDCGGVGGKWVSIRAELNQEQTKS